MLVLQQCMCPCADIPYLWRCWPSNQHKANEKLHPFCPAGTSSQERAQCWYGSDFLRYSPCPNLWWGAFKLHEEAKQIRCILLEFTDDCIKWKVSEVVNIIWTLYHKGALLKHFFCLVSINWRWWLLKLQQAHFQSTDLSYQLFLALLTASWALHLKRLQLTLSQVHAWYETCLLSCLWLDGNVCFTVWNIAAFQCCFWKVALKFFSDGTEFHLVCRRACRLYFMMMTSKSCHLLINVPVSSIIVFKLWFIFSK